MLGKYGFSWANNEAAIARNELRKKTHEFRIIAIFLETEVVR